ncbi:MAG: PTS-dependent dihydroxyacetone kinase phosphotransferase subunit DhaM [Lachnospiraceae bacterium]|nr:PTS-dependent dihydroxyacetone kinase phosphotransferase subunit DhaM [Lachnospiraceae bacterium]
MVGFVLVSHSQKLAEGAKELGGIMAPDVPVEAAGGLDDGGIGTSYEKISTAIEKVNSPDGVLVIMDMGSSVMTTEMVIEDIGDPNVIMVDCSFVEGAVAAIVSSSCGSDLAECKKVAEEAGAEKKF